MGPTARPPILRAVSDSAGCGIDAGPRAPICPPASFRGRRITAVKPIAHKKTGVGVSGLFRQCPVRPFTTAHRAERRDSRDSCGRSVGKHAVFGVPARGTVRDSRDSYTARDGEVSRPSRPVPRHGTAFFPATPTEHHRSVPTVPAWLAGEASGRVSQVATIAGCTTQTSESSREHERRAMWLRAASRSSVRRASPAVPL